MDDNIMLHFGRMVGAANRAHDEYLKICGARVVAAVNATDQTIFRHFEAVADLVDSRFDPIPKGWLVPALNTANWDAIDGKPAAEAMVFRTSSVSAKDYDCTQVTLAAQCGKLIVLAIELTRYSDKGAIL